MKRFTAVPTLFVALVACQEPTKSAIADSETSTPLSVRTTAGTFTVLVPTSGATGPSLAVFGSGNDTHCAGTAPSGTYNGNVVVNPNAVCNLSGSTVTGNLIARENSTLIAENNDIRGNVELLQTGLVSIGGSLIGGSILGDKPKRGLDIYRSRIGGTILAKDGTAFIGLCGNTLTNGPIVLEKNRNSSILVGGDACVDFGGGNILENVDIKVDDNEVLVVSGVPSNGLQIGDNQVGQHLQVFKNRGGLSKVVARNTVGASLQCIENTTPFVGEPNVAQEVEGQCRASAPPPPPPPPPPAPVASVTVAPSAATVEQGKTVQLTATTRDASGNVLTGRAVTWTSLNTAVATVSSSGLVTGVAAGEPATIQATSEGQTGTAQITVTAPPPPAPVASVTVAPSSATVQPGQTVQLTATTRDANGAVLTGRTVGWTSSNTAVATVSSSGLVTAVAPSAEPVTITATSEGKTGTAQITVPPVASVAVAPSAATVEQGKTVQLTATTRDASGNVLTGRAVTWTSLNTAVATVSSSGLVTGVAAGGPATIEAASEGQTGTAEITVTAPPPPPPPPAPVFSVTVTPSSATVQPGQTVQLTATTRAEDGTVLTGRTVTWASSNTAVATVSSSGLVRGVAPSAEPATITATSEGKTGTAQITVPPVASVTVAPSTASVEAGKTVQLTATTRDASGNVLTGRSVAWRSLNTAVATVSSSGLVTGVAAGGPATIEAASEGQTGTAQITVTAPPPPPPVTNSPTCAQYPEPRIWLESQGWWDSRGLVIPSRVGEHIHVGTCWPVTPDGGDATVSGTVHFDVRVVLHDHTGTTDILRVAQESIIRQIMPFVMGPATDETRWVSYDVNTNAWDTGRREWRWTANVPRNSEGNRHFQSTGWQLCVRACTPNETYRAGPWTEGRGWYDDGHLYQNARFLSKLPYAPLSGLWTFRVRLVQSGVGGVFIDPDFHAGNQGIKIASGGYDGNLTIDTRTLSNGIHRLVLVASDNQSAGVQVIEFRVAN